MREPSKDLALAFIRFRFVFMKRIPKSELERNVVAGDLIKVKNIAVSHNRWFSA